MKRALIVDGHVIARLGLKVVLKELYSGAVIEEAQDQLEAEEKLKKADFDLCMLDLNLPQTDSLLFLRKVKELRPTMKVLVISMNNEVLFAVNAIRNGALGYVLKDNEIEVIKEAIKRVLDNRKYMSDKVLSMLLDTDGYSRGLSNPFSRLSGREIMIAQCLISGLTTSQIAERANLQLSTISTYKGKIFNKLQINSTIELFELSRLHQFSGFEVKEDELEDDKKLEEAVA